MSSAHKQFNGVPYGSSSFTTTFSPLKTLSYGDNGVNILRVPSNRVAINKGSGRSWLVLKYFNAGLPNTGDNSFFDYPFTVVR